MHSEIYVEPPEKASLSTLKATASRFVAWREKLIKDRLVKVPFDPNNIRGADHSDPDTWGTYAEAERRRRTLGGKGGIGIVLGDLGDGFHLAGIDLDSCLSGGKLTPWAAEVVEHFQVYAERSPSGNGVKLFFLIRTDDMPDVLAALGENAEGEQRFGAKWGPRGSHVGIEFYAARRYFTVTGDAFSDLPDNLFTADLEDVLWLIREAGPGLKGAVQDDSPKGEDRDESNSGYGLRFLIERAFAGDTFDDALDAMRDDEGPAGAWIGYATPRDLKRAWTKALKKVQRDKVDPNKVFSDADVEQDAKPAGLTFIRPGRDRAAEIDRPYVVKGLVEPGNVSCIFGMPSSGKSVIAPFLGYMVAQGKPFFGMRTKPGKVFYVAAEDPKGLTRRMDLLAERFGSTDDFILIPDAGALHKGKDGFRKLLAAVEAERPALVIIDTLARAFPGLDENDASAMSAVVTVAEKLAAFGAAVIYVHHSTKEDSPTPRGHSSLDGALFMGLHVQRDKQTGVVRGTLTKNKQGTEDRDIGFRIKTETIGTDADGDEMTTVVLEECAALPKVKPERLPKSEQAALALLGDGLSEDDWRKACVDSRTVSGAETEEDRARVVRRVFTELARKKRVVFDNGKVTLAQVGKAASRFTDDGDDDDSP